MKQRQHLLFRSAVTWSAFIAALFGSSCRVIEDRPVVSSSGKHEIRLTGQNPRQKAQFHLTSLLLTYSMVQSPSWEVNWFAASQEIPRISRNPKVYYRTHKRPPPACILGQPNPVHIPTSHLLEIRHNIIHSSTPGSPQWSLSLRFPHQEPIRPPLLTHTRHMPAHLILLDFITRTIIEQGSLRNKTGGGDFNAFKISNWAFVFLSRGKLCRSTKSFA